VDKLKKALPGADINRGIEAEKPKEAKPEEKKKEEKKDEKKEEKK
jgi:hypothetical protein